LQQKFSSFDHRYLKDNPKLRTISVLKLFADTLEHSTVWFRASINYTPFSLLSRTAMSIQSPMDSWTEAAMLLFQQLVLESLCPEGLRMQFDFNDIVS
jgi:hypothetical protein